MSDPGKAVFLSYASQDAEAAKRICDALRAAGVEVWFDQSELVGGDAWDQKIRKQIKDCALLIPIISAATQSRTEGYFRLEWRLADQRTHLMAKGRAFLLPVVIDNTHDSDAHVPDSFAEVQWTKAPGGAVPATFAARVKKLLDGEVVEAGRPRPAEPLDVAQDRQRDGGTPPPGKSRPRWLAPVIAGGVITLLALVFARPWEKAPSPTGPAKAIETPTGATLTPAQELVAKARTILEQGDELNRETYALAEELLVKAEALDVTEASAWVLHAKVSASRIGYGLDRSAARHEALRTQTGRAIQLAPGLLDAQLAECEAFIVFEQDVPGVITRLQALADKYPNDWRVPDLLSWCYRVLGKLDDGLVVSERAMKLSPDNPRLKSNRINGLVFSGRWTEAEAAIAPMLQGRTGARLLAHDVYLKLMWSGDLAGAATAVKSWPAWFLLEDRGVGHAALVALWNRDPGRALEVVRKFPRDYIRDFLFTGPSAVLSAWANEQAGNVESARADWRIVQQVAERELQSAPNDQFALHWKAWALARLGEKPTAASILQQLLEKKLTLSAMGQVVGGLGGLAHTVGRTDLALAQIALNPPGSRAITKTDLRLNPLFDPLRGDSRFQGVIDAALGPAEKREVAPVSPARLLAEKAMALSIANENSSTGLLAAADVAEKAAQLDSTDGEVWAVAAMVDIRCWVHGADRTDRRVELARTKVVRAKGLAPRSIPVRFAEARMLTELDLSPEGYAKAEAILRELRNEDINPGLAVEITGMLGIAVGKQGRGPESARLLEEAGRAGPGWMHAASWAYLSVFMFPEALHAAQQEAARDGIKGLLQQVTVQLVRGDLDAANVLLEQIPVAERTDEYPASAIAGIAYFRREGERMLAAVKSIPGDFQSSTFLYGPKADSLAWAHLLAGHQEAAKVNWRAALAAVDERIATRGSDPTLLRLRLNYLAKLDRPDEAAQVYRLLQELRGDGVYLEQAADLALLGRKEEALAALTESLRRKSNQFCFAVARYDPIFDPLRGDPRFESLLRETLPPGSKPFDDAQGRPFDDAKPSSSAQATADREVKL